MKATGFLQYQPPAGSIETFRQRFVLPNRRTLIPVPEF
jgi:hypothetical protein